MPSDLIQAVKAKVPDPPLPPVSDAALTEAEASLGFRLPDLLRELYLHVGNGGFGPGYGLFSLDDARHGEDSLVGVYRGTLKSPPEFFSWQWPAGLLPFCDWDCAMYSCLDCARAPYPVSTYEYAEGAMESSFAPTRDSLESWLRDWLAGISVFEPVYEHAPELDRTFTNPFTKKPGVIKGRRPRRR